MGSIAQISCSDPAASEAGYHRSYNAFLAAIKRAGAGGKNRVADSEMCQSRNIQQNKRAAGIRH